MVWGLGGRRRFPQRREEICSFAQASWHPLVAAAQANSVTPLLVTYGRCSVGVSRRRARLLPRPPTRPVPSRPGRLGVVPPNLICSPLNKFCMGSGPGPSRPLGARPEYFTWGRRWWSCQTRKEARGRRFLGWESTQRGGRDSVGLCVGSGRVATATHAEPTLGVHGTAQPLPGPLPSAGVGRCTSSTHTQAAKHGDPNLTSHLA